MEEDVRTGLIFSSIAFNLSVISALLLIHSANAALHFVVWSIFPCLWIPLVKNADHADASFRSRSSSLSLVSQVSSSLAHGSSKLSPFTRELLPQPLWSCRTAIKITNNIVPNLKQATTKRLREQFAEGESDWSLRAVSPRLRGLRFFPKVSKAGRKHQSFTHKITIPTTPLTWCKTYIPSMIGLQSPICLQRISHDSS